MIGIFWIAALLALNVAFVTGFRLQEVLVSPGLILTPANITEATDSKQNLLGKSSSLRSNQVQSKAVVFEPVVPLSSYYSAIVQIVEDKLNSLILTARTVSIRSDIDLNFVCNLKSSEPMIYKRGEIQKGVKLFVTVNFIDGTGDILGFAGPCVVYNSLTNDIPWVIFGTIVLDIADLNTLTKTEMVSLILHEGLHALGFGTLWNDFNIVNNLVVTNPRYLGENGNAAYKVLLNLKDNSTTYIPIEDTGGTGSQLSHWRNSVFGAEIMTAYFTVGSQPFSNMTAMALRDIGYDVNFDSPTIDNYIVPSGAHNFNLDHKLTTLFVAVLSIFYQTQ